MEMGNDKRKCFPCELWWGLKQMKTFQFVISKDGKVYKYLLNKIYFNDITQHLLSIMLYVMYIKRPL